MSGQRCPMTKRYDQEPLRPSFEHERLRVGMVADLTGRASNDTVRDALTILENLEHRGATAIRRGLGRRRGNTVTQVPDLFIRQVFDAGATTGSLRDRALDGASGQRPHSPSSRNRPRPCPGGTDLTSLEGRPLVDSSLLGPTSRAGEPTLLSATHRASRRGVRLDLERHFLVLAR